MTDELRKLQIEQTKLMQRTERLISTCSKQTDIDFPDPKTIADRSRLLELNWELLDASIEFGTVLFAASKADLPTPEYRELGDEFCKALKLYMRADTVIRAPGHERTSVNL